jgi:flagellar hook-associated protein 1 FlgK
MSLSTSFNIGRSALDAAQIGITTTGNNTANAATQGFTRQVTSFAPTSDTRSGSLFLGRGVGVAGVRRQVDNALQQRLWGGLSGESSASTDAQLLGTVETTLNALGNDNVGSQITGFFNAWSELASNPGVSASRTLVVNKGVELADRLRQLRENLESQRGQIDQTLISQSKRVDDLLNQVAGLNAQIVTAEGGLGQSSGLRDQRDLLVTELAKLVNVTTVETGTGALDVYVGSSPVVLAGRSRGAAFRQYDDNGTTVTQLVTGDNNEALSVTSGSIGSLLNQRTTLVQDSIARLDAIATNLIERVNRLYSEGQSGVGQKQVIGATSMRTGDNSLPMNDPNNQSFAALKIKPRSGSFQITVQDPSGGRVTRSVLVDLDGVTLSGAAGTANDSSVDSVLSNINSSGIGATATVTPDGRIQISVPDGYSLTFAQDTSGFLSALGINTYFQGQDATDIGVRADLKAAPATLNIATLDNGTRDDAGVARRLSQLRDTKVDGLGGLTFNGAWSDATQSVGVRASAAKTSADSAGVVRQSLEAQRSAISGVNLDEEAINLITYQRQYQAGARFISVVSELTQTLLRLV